MSWEEDLLKFAADNNAFLLLTDLCLGCYSADKPLTRAISVKLRMKIKDKEYPAVCILLCDDCAKAKDLNRLKKNMQYLILEGEIDYINA